MVKAAMKFGRILGLGTPVVPFCPLYFGVSLLKLNSRKKGTLVIDGLLENLEDSGYEMWVQVLG